jgi:DNA-binding ferritin-like protein (Dps family)
MGTQFNIRYDFNVIFQKEESNSGSFTFDLDHANLAYIIYSGEIGKDPFDPSKVSLISSHEEVSKFYMTAKETFGNDVNAFIRDVIDRAKEWDDLELKNINDNGPKEMVNLFQEVNKYIYEVLVPKVIELFKSHLEEDLS